MKTSWRDQLARRLGWSLGAASLWVWGLLLLRIPRDGWPGLEIWFSYALSFLMTAVYVYLGQLVWAALKAESRGLDREAEASDGGRWSALLAWRERARRPVALLGVLGLVVAIGSLAGWLALRYPGPQAASGTLASVVLALMVAGVALAATLIARGAER